MKFTDIYKRSTLKLLFILLSFTTIITSCTTDSSELNDSIVVNREGATIPAHIRGNSKSDIFVIVLHGGPGSSGFEYRFDPFASLLEKKYGVVYTDQRGQGMSEGYLSLDQLTPEFLAGDVYALGLAIKKKFGSDIKLVLMGHSWGGMLGSAVMVDEKYSSIFDVWINIDGAHDFDRTYKDSYAYLKELTKERLSASDADSKYWSDIKYRLDEIDTIGTEDGFIKTNQIGHEIEKKLAEEHLINKSETNIDFTYFKNNFIKNNYVQAWYTNTLGSLLFVNSGLTDKSFSSQLHKIDKPTLVLWGKHDYVVAPKLGINGYNALTVEKKRFHLFEKSAHSPMVTEPYEFIMQVNEFIDEVL